jgi:hypothetical protein
MSQSNDRGDVAMIPMLDFARDGDLLSSKDCINIYYQKSQLRLFMIEGKTGVQLGTTVERQYQKTDDVSILSICSRVLVDNAKSKWKPYDLFKT